MTEKASITKNDIKSTFRGLVNGSIVASDFVRKQIPFILVLFVIGLIYIANRYHAISVFRETELTKREIEDLRAEKIEIQSNLMTNSRLDKIIKKLEEAGSSLKDSKVPPQKISYHIEE